MSCFVSGCFAQDVVGSQSLYAFKKKSNILMGEENPLTLIKCKTPLLLLKPLSCGSPEAGRVLCAVLQRLCPLLTLTKRAVPGYRQRRDSGRDETVS